MLTLTSITDSFHSFCMMVLSLNELSCPCRSFSRRKRCAASFMRRTFHSPLIQSVLLTSSPRIIPSPRSYSPSFSGQSSTQQHSFPSFSFPGFDGVHYLALSSGRLQHIMIWLFAWRSKIWREWLQKGGRRKWNKTSLRCASILYIYAHKHLWIFSIPLFCSLSLLERDCWESIYG